MAGPSAEEAEKAARARPFAVGAVGLLAVLWLGSSCWREGEAIEADRARAEAGLGTEAERVFRVLAPDWRWEDPALGKWAHLAGYRARYGRLLGNDGWRLTSSCIVTLARTERGNVALEMFFRRERGWYRLTDIRVREMP